jgi:NNP family nitrate/nitrite transporter-like MFS transporter
LWDSGFHASKGDWALTGNSFQEFRDDSSTSFRSQLGPLLFLAAIFFLNFIARIIMAPLMPTIEQDLNITHSQAGSLFLLVTLGYFPSLVGSGFVSSRLTHRKTIVLSSVTLGLALLLVSQCTTLWAIRVGLVVLGLSAGFYLPSGIATLTSLISSRHWGKALAIHELAPNLSFLTAPLISEALLRWVSWRGILGLLGVATLLTGAAFARFGRGGKFPGETLNLGSIKILFTNRSFWIVILLFGLGVSGTLGIYTMLPLYLVVEKGFERHWANSLIALSRILVPGMSFLSGWGTDRLGPKRTLFGVFLLASLLTVLLGITSGSWLVLVILIQPLLAACFFPAGFVALSLVVPPAFRNVAVSISAPFSTLFGGGIIPILIGVAGDAGTFSLGIVLVGVLVFSGTVLSRFLTYSAQSTESR